MKNEANMPAGSDINRLPLPPAMFTTELTNAIDRSYNAALAQLTGGLAPRVLTMAYFTWLIHLSTSPGKQSQLIEKGLRKLTRLFSCSVQSASGGGKPFVEPLPQDHRFVDSVWQQWPFNIWYQSFLLTQQWWHNATTGVPGLDTKNEDIVEFATRQWLDIFSPSNSLLNPEVLRATAAEGGANFIRGWQNFVDDWQWMFGGDKPPGVENYRVGKEVAITPGQVVYRNHLIELIQYAPMTEQVHAEPVLIVPAWIMKYYILDLSPENSLVKYLVEHGYTVFMISWRNPTEKDRDLGMEDYRESGIMAALEAINTIVPERRVHTVGYCLGGTLLTIAAAAMARDDDDRIQSLTLFAAQTDFTEAGELSLFINEGQVNFLESMMWKNGVLDAKQMSGAFQLLRSNDLIWSRMVHDYMLGKRRSINDLMAWNADTTRMPYRMHSEYLRQIFLNNDLAVGRYKVGGRPIVMSEIRSPVFAVGALEDHVAPWRSVFKIHLLADAGEVTFVLTSGGHNAGIVSEPGHPHRNYQIATRKVGDNYVDPDTWQANTLTEDGSWWPGWVNWLARHSSGKGEPPQLGAPGSGYAQVCEAPGTYVMQD